MLNLEELIDWKLVMEAPRYAGGHEDVMNAMFGNKAKVISNWVEDDYQGTTAWAYEFEDGTVAIMTDWFGSCSGCDAWEDCTDDDARNMILGLCGSAKHFQTLEQAKDWTKNISPREEPTDFPWEAAQNLFKDGA